jgi:putative membrane protein
MKTLFKILQGALIGLGAVLPGISGGVLCVIFGIYKPVMELLSHPFKNFKTHVPKLIPVIIGVGIGFLGIANVLAFFLEKYPAPSVCLFIGLIAGMLPSLWREAGEQGRNEDSYISLTIAMMLIFGLLISLKLFSVTITPSFIWYVFCGFCLALSVIAPGMSFSTLLMPLGLYTPFIDGIGNLDFSILIPAGIGGLVTVILFAKAVNLLFEKHYSVAFHAIVGIVVAATIMIIPGESFMNFTQATINIVCLAVGAVAAVLLDKFNTKYSEK